MTRQKLPIGVQTFAKIRRDHYYVDKTGYAQRLVDEGGTYFLSRPRRFGKSLFLDTLAEMFAGNKALFEGLACYDTWDWDTAYPVVRISFGSGGGSSRAEMDQRTGEILASNERRLGVPEGSGSLPGRLSLLVEAAEARYGQPVVVLVDEYDKPILDNLTDPEAARQMRDGLRYLYGVLKDLDAHLKFVLLTGVSKFSKVNIFSGLNNLNDITIDPRYSAVCGYTDDDVDTVFAPELDGLDRDKIRQWYNGYSWTGQTVYNPYDLLLLFDKRRFAPHWFESGTPKFLVDMLVQRRFHLPDLERLEASSSMLSTFEVDDMSTEALLFQTGYLTVRQTVETVGLPRYVLGFPNMEVRASLTEALLKACSPDPGQAVVRAGRLPDLLAAADFAGIEALFKAHFESIPYNWYARLGRTTGRLDPSSAGTEKDSTAPIARYEGYYSSVFYAFFASLGLDVVPEDASNTGRLDLAVRYAGQVFLFELKVVADQPTGAALQQVKDRHYADKYLADGVPVHQIGIEFSSQARNIVAFEVETVTL